MKSIYQMLGLGKSDKVKKPGLGKSDKTFLIIQNWLIEKTWETHW